MPARIVVLAAHPEMHQSHATRALMDAAAKVEGVEVRDLYARYPDFLVDTAAEQRALEAAALVVWLHPIHWYHMPPLMALWRDEVLAFGWAYGPGGVALQGKDLWLAASTGGSSEAYSTRGHNRYYFDAFLPAYEQTAALCGMRFLPPLVLHGAHRASAAEVAAHAEVFRERLASYPRWEELETLEPCDPCHVPVEDRPRLEDPAVTPVELR